MKSVSVNISDGRYAKFRNILRQKDIGIEEGISKAINDFVFKESVYERDPFFKIGSFGESGAKDVSRKHDSYPYEQ